MPAETVLYRFSCCFSLQPFLVHNETKQSQLVKLWLIVLMVGSGLEKQYKSLVNTLFFHMLVSLCHGWIYFDVSAAHKWNKNCFLSVKQHSLKKSMRYFDALLLKDILIDNTQTGCCEFENLQQISAVGLALYHYNMTDIIHMDLKCPNNACSTMLG